MVHSVGASSRGNFRFGLHVSGRIQPILLLAIGFEIRITLALHTRSLVESTSRQKCVFSTRQGRAWWPFEQIARRWPTSCRIILRQQDRFILFLSPSVFAVSYVHCVHPSVSFPCLTRTLMIPIHCPNPLRPNKPLDKRFRASLFLSMT